ncbi:hypothetical protein BDFB_004507 [Asbolus verrucosus]
MPTGP